MLEGVDGVIVVYRGNYAEIQKDGTVVGKAESWTVDLVGNFERYYEVGKRYSEEGMLGNLEVTVSLSRMWIDIDYLKIITGESTLTSFSLLLYPRAISGAPSGTPYIYLKKCYPSGASLDIPQDGWIMEDVDIEALGQPGIDIITGKVA